MQNVVKETIDNYNMLKKSDRCIIAVSGGADSVSLLHVLMQLNNIYKVRYRVVHVHHGIRGEEADRDADFVKKLCKKYNLPCRVIKVKALDFASKHHLSVEEAARLLRYQALEKEAHSWELNDDTEKRVKIAVAHNKEDNAETVIMQLCRGSGLRGIAGMSPIRGRIIRPLLYVSRKDIEEFAKKEELSFVTDSTNLDDEYTRNRIRHDILPRLTEGVNKAAIDNITRAAMMAGQADNYLLRVAAKLVNANIIEENGRVGVPLDIIGKQEYIIQTYMVRLLIARINMSMKDIVARHIDDVARLIHMQTGKCIDLPYRLVARRDYDTIWIEKKNHSVHVEKQPVLKFKAFARDFSKPIPEDKDIKWFDFDSIEGLMEVRTRQVGDYLTIGGVGRKSLKSYMTDAKIPAEKRDSIPVLAVGSHIMWVVGYRISEGYKVTDSTKTVLQVRYTTE